MNIAVGWLSTQLSKNTNKCFPFRDHCVSAIIEENVRMNNELSIILRSWVEVFFFFGFAAEWDEARSQ